MMMDRISALSEVLPYVRQFLGKTFVVKMGGEICTPEYLPHITRQISLMHHIGIKIVVVHGGGPQMDELAEALHVERQVVNGRRITDDETLEIAKMVFAGKISTEVVSALRAEGALSVGLSGADAKLILAKKRSPVQMTDKSGKVVEVDFGHVGDIEKINRNFLKVLFDEGVIPVIASLGADEYGNVLNINADTVASALAKTLHAEKLIVMTNVPGILRNAADTSSLVSYLDIEGVQRMIEEGAIKDGMHPKVSACVDALQNGVARTHIIDGTRKDSLLLELFMNEGVGTMIVSKM